MSTPQHPADPDTDQHIVELTSLLTDEPGTSPAAAGERYGEIVRAVDQRFAEEYASIDGSYSRAQQYAGLVRQELLQTATWRRHGALQRAWGAYQDALNQISDNTEGDTADAAGNE